MSTTKSSHERLHSTSNHRKAQPALAVHSPKANPPTAATKTAARMPVPLTPILSAELAPITGPAATVSSVESDTVADGAAAPVDNVTGAVELLREVAS